VVWFAQRSVPQTHGASPQDRQSAGL